MNLGDEFAKLLGWALGTLFKGIIYGMAAAFAIIVAVTILNAVGVGH